MKAYLAILTVILISSCKKNDHIPRDFSKCKIDYIVYNENKSTRIVGKFNYNDMGDPESIIISDENTGAPSYHFQYDTRRRLTAFIYSYGVEDNGQIQDTIFAEMRQFIYHNNLIVGDSVFFMTSLSNKYEQGYGRGYYKYDKWGRIVEYKLDVRIPEIEPYTRIYSYSYANENPYVNNKSVMGTHPVLMFVNRDYNKSNQQVAEVNKFGFPTKFKFSFTDNYHEGGYKFGTFLKFHEVYYQCDGPNKAVK